MRQFSTEVPSMTAGVDISDRWSQVYVVDAAGECVEEARVRTAAPALQKWFGSRPRMRVVLEVGTHSPWISRLLASYGHEVLVANARKVRLIYQNDRKTDRLDAACLAREVVAIRGGLVENVGIDSVRSERAVSLPVVRGELEPLLLLTQEVREELRHGAYDVEELQGVFHANLELVMDLAEDILEPRRELGSQIKSRQVRRFGH